MHRSLIIAKIAPGAEPEIARIFAESDRTELPRLATVAHRSLYSLGDLYVHLLDTLEPGPVAVAGLRGHPEFDRISDRLSQYVSPYLSTWRSPQDALATCFYSWHASPGDGTGDPDGDA